MESNTLIQIESNSFHGLANLKKLNIKNNQIKKIENDGFKGLDNLKVLSYGGNELKFIDLNLISHMNK